MRRFALTFTACLLGVCVPAVAKPPTNTGSAPSGNSGVNQYIESIPTNKGNKPTSSVHSGGGGGNTHGGGIGGGSTGGGTGGSTGGGSSTGGSTAGSGSSSGSNGATISRSTQRAL